MSFAARRIPARRHTVAFWALALVVLSPLSTWLLPLQWQGLMSESSETHPVTNEWLLFRDNDSGKIDAQKNAPFLFITREGTPGMLYVGIPVIDDSLTPGVRRGPTNADSDLDPVAFRQGRRFGSDVLVPAE